MLGSPFGRLLNAVRDQPVRVSCLGHDPRRIRQVCFVVAAALAGLAGGAAGPWITGILYDLFGNYTLAFAIGIAVSVLSAVAIWLAGPRHIRAVAGRIDRIGADAQAA